MGFKGMDRREQIFFWITFYATCIALYDPLYIQGRWKPIISIPLILVCSVIVSILAIVFTRVLIWMFYRK